MSREPFVFAILAFAIVNGLFSPGLALAFPLVLVFYPGFLPASPGILLFSTSLLVSTVTIMLAGIPAAIYERAVGARESTNASLWVWLAGTAFLSLPAVTNALRLL